MKIPGARYIRYPNVGGAKQPIKKSSSAGVKTASNGWLKRWETTVVNEDLEDFRSALQTMRGVDFYIMAFHDVGGPCTIMIQFKKPVQSYKVEDIVGSTAQPLNRVGTKTWVQYWHGQGYWFKPYGRGDLRLVYEILPKYKKENGEVQRAVPQTSAAMVASNKSGIPGPVVLEL